MDYAPIPKFAMAKVVFNDRITAKKTLRYPAAFVAFAAGIIEVDSIG